MIDLPWSRELLAGAGLDLPLPGTPSDVYALTFEGWAVGRNSPASGVEISGAGYPWRSLPVSVRRADIDALAGIEWAVNGGFRAAISSLRLPEQFDLEVVIRLEDGSRTPLARVIGRRRPFAASQEHALRPIMLTTLGRTGSTWITALLGAHQEVVAFRPYTYEARVASYWSEILLALSEPQSYLQSVAGDVYGWDWWTGRAGSARRRRWSTTRRWSAFSARTTSRTWPSSSGAASRPSTPGSQTATTPSYFVEKTWPASPAPVVLREFYPGTKEIFLVRDPRDVALSTIDYNAKRGFLAFGREAVASDEEYIRGPLRVGTEQLLEAWLRARRTRS